MSLFTIEAFRPLLSFSVANKPGHLSLTSCIVDILKSFSVHYIHYNMNVCIHNDYVVLISMLYHPYISN